MVVTSSEMQALEERAFVEGASAEELMDEAGAGIAGAVQQFFSRPGTCVVVFGKGHNGGDALVAARHLAIAGWETFLLPAFPEEGWTELTRKKFGEAGLCRLFESGSEDWSTTLENARCLQEAPIVVLDGLLGVGASGALRAPLGDLVRRINGFRESAHAQVFSIDIPTGLDPDHGVASSECVIADYTIAIGYAKRGLMADPAIDYVGRLVVLALAKLRPAAGDTPRCETVATSTHLASLLPRRKFESHKGLFGRVSIVAGSRGFTGAAVMCSAGCVRAGAGLVSLFVPEDVYSIVAATALPEVMVHPVTSYDQVLETKCDVLALGPGLGRSRAQEILNLIHRSPGPTVIDADGLNALAERMETLEHCSVPILITPHPGEMARLDRPPRGLSRRDEAREFVARNRVTLLLKGARTIVAEAGRPLSYNTTGHPGMATGGMGDVLTGVCAALAGQGLSLYNAARLGAWLCGRAAELALSEGNDSQESLSPSELIKYLGLAFRHLHERCY